MQKYVRMSILILIPFLNIEIVLLFPCSLARTTDEINKSIHGVPVLVVSS